MTGVIQNGNSGTGAVFSQPTQMTCTILLNASHIRRRNIALILAI